jgi:hypothetical protein
MPKKTSNKNADSAREIDISTTPLNASKANSAKITKKSRGGRKRAIDRPPASPELFPSGTPHRIASSRVIWEGANILTQQEDLPWRDSSNGFCYESEISRGRGYLAFWLTQDLSSETPSILESEAALALIDEFDIRAACMHLIYSAYATQLDCPWKDQFVLDDRHLERYLGLEKNTNMNESVRNEYSTTLETRLY